MDRLFVIKNIDWSLNKFQGQKLNNPKGGVKWYDFAAIDVVQSDYIRKIGEQNIKRRNLLAAYYIMGDLDNSVIEKDLHNDFYEKNEKLYDSGIASPGGELGHMALSPFVPVLDTLHEEDYPMASTPMVGMDTGIGSPEMGIGSPDTGFGSPDMTPDVTPNVTPDVTLEQDNLNITNSTLNDSAKLNDSDIDNALLEETAINQDKVNVSKNVFIGENLRADKNNKSVKNTNKSPEQALRRSTRVQQSGVQEPGFFSGFYRMYGSNKNQ